jgi:uncharacterized protein (TIGR03435 family)
MTMKSLAGFLSQITQQSGRPVLDMTGLTGVFDVTLDFVPDATTGDNNADPDIFSALLNLGLKLEPRMAPLEVIVIDRALKPSEN